MAILNFKDFMKSYKIKNFTVIESEIQRVINFPIYPRDSKILSDKGFVNIENSSMGENNWTCFIVKDNKSYYYDSFGGTPDKFLLNQLPKPIKYQIQKKTKILYYVAQIVCIFSI